MSDSPPKAQTASRDAPRGPGPEPGSPALEERVLGAGEKPPESPGRGKPEMANPATMKRRHWGQVASLVLVVLLPVILVGVYLFAFAEDQYASTTGFSVQREEGATASDFLGIIPGLNSGSGAADADVLYEFIQSQEIVERIDAKLDLRAHYSQHWKGMPWNADKVFSIWPDASMEELLWFWNRVVRISYDKSAGLIELTVFAFEPDFAQALAQEIVVESQIMINNLSEAAREDSMRYALADLDEALERLKTAREALTTFRTRTQIVDPEADIQGRLGVLNNLQQQLAQALINYDLLLDTTNDGDPRLQQAQRRIEVIQERIASERDSFASSETKTGSAVDDYPIVIAEFERLATDREYAEEAYRAALSALDVARAKAARQSRYLVTYIDPTRAQTSQYPQRWIIFGLTILFLILTWSIGALIYYSIRDRG